MLKLLVVLLFLLEIDEDGNRRGGQRRNGGRTVINTVNPFFFKSDTSKAKIGWSDNVFLFFYHIQFWQKSQLNSQSEIPVKIAQDACASLRSGA